MSRRKSFSESILLGVLKKALGIQMTDNNYRQSSSHDCIVTKAKHKHVPQADGTDLGEEGFQVVDELVGVKYTLERADTAVFIDAVLLTTLMLIARRNQWEMPHFIDSNQNSFSLTRDKEYLFVKADAKALADALVSTIEKTGLSPDNPNIIRVQDAIDFISDGSFTLFTGERNSSALIASAAAHQIVVLHLVDQTKVGVANLYKHFLENLKCDDEDIDKVELTYFCAALMARSIRSMSKYHNNDALCTEVVLFLLNEFLGAKKATAQDANQIFQNYECRDDKYGPMIFAAVSHKKHSEKFNPLITLLHHMYDCVTHRSKRAQVKEILIYGSVVDTLIHQQINFVRVYLCDAENNSETEFITF